MICQPLFFPPEIRNVAVNKDTTSHTWNEAFYIYIICDKGKVILGRLPDHRPVSPHAHLLFRGILVDFGTLLSIEYVEVSSNVFVFHDEPCESMLQWVPFLHPCSKSERFNMISFHRFCYVCITLIQFNEC
jgi:hypothetical protein